MGRRADDCLRSLKVGQRWLESLQLAEQRGRGKKQTGKGFAGKDIYKNELSPSRGGSWIRDSKLPTDHLCSGKKPKTKLHLGTTAQAKRDYYLGCSRVAVEQVLSDESHEQKKGVWVRELGPVRETGVSRMA